VIWMLDPKINMANIAKNHTHHSLSSNRIQKYNQKIKQAIEKQLEAIYKEICANGSDSYLLTEHKDPSIIFHSLLTRKDLVNTLKDDIHPDSAILTGEIYNPEEPFGLESNGCVNMVGGACEMAKIPFELGTVLPYNQAF